MNSITQDLKFKQSVVEYSLKYGVTRKTTKNFIIAGTSSLFSFVFMLNEFQYIKNIIN